jgi:hypothetical protein
MTEVEIIQLVDGELRRGDARSEEYRQGMIDLLMRRSANRPMPWRHTPGTPQFDAYQSGVDRGWTLYHALKEKH